MLWQTVEQFVVANSAVKTGTVSDMLALKGQGAGMGAKHSGTLGSNKVLMSGLGIDIESDFSLVYGGYGPTADALANGQIVAAGIPLRATNRGNYQAHGR